MSNNLENKKTVRTLINEELLSNVTGGGNKESWWETCPQCHESIKCYQNSTLEDHMSKWCPAK